MYFRCIQSSPRFLFLCFSLILFIICLLFVFLSLVEALLVAFLAQAVWVVGLVGVATADLWRLPLLCLFDRFRLAMDFFGAGLLGRGSGRRDTGSSRRWLLLGRLLGVLLGLILGGLLIFIFTWASWLRLKRLLIHLWGTQRLPGRIQILNFHFWLLCWAFWRTDAQITHQRLRRRQTLANLLLLAVHAQLGLVNLVLDVVDRLHYPICLLPELREEADVLHVAVVDVLDQVGLNHAVGDGVWVLDPPLEFHLQLLILK